MLNDLVIKINSSSVTVDFKWVHFVAKRDIQLEILEVEPWKVSLLTKQMEFKGQNLLCFAGIYVAFQLSKLWISIRSLVSEHQGQNLKIQNVADADTYRILPSWPVAKGQQFLNRLHHNADLLTCRWCHQHAETSRHSRFWSNLWPFSVSLGSLWHDLDRRPALTDCRLTGVMEHQFMANIHDKSAVRQTSLPVNKTEDKPWYWKDVFFLRNCWTQKKIHHETASVCSYILKMIPTSRRAVIL